ncbi:hypothetical protein N7450_009356 [Penicillium hetheringtonii]|uniref:Uncharacterized protein n=1 Tax=Penicillium hetheringtonii TaxID=911720 RepID=A0AAD6GP78_9EURO|nr:hypothetical protein N7450_009356 [Penicillium hetheringtonii]
MNKGTNAKDNRSPAEIFTARSFLDLENFLSTPRIVEAKKDWQGSPHQTLIGDFEYHTRLKRYGETFVNYFSHVSIFQFYLHDATGKPIVEALQIDHGLTQEILFTEGLQVLQANGDPHDPDKGKSIEILQRLVDKIYNPEVAKAFPDNVLTLNDIADKIRDHVNEHGPILHFHEWSANRGDYQCLWNILAAVGAEDLLQSCPKSLNNQSPYHWWRQTARKYNVPLASGTLALGKLYKSIFPKNEDLVNKWHFAEADVKMTRDLIEFYFDRVLDDSETEPELPYSDNEDNDEDEDEDENEDEDEDSRPWDAGDNPPLDAQKILTFQFESLDIDHHVPSADNYSGWNGFDEIASKSSNSAKRSINFRQFEAESKGIKRAGEPENSYSNKRLRRR